MKPLRVLVGCEFSGTVREAFAKRGHEAWSCDLLPTEIEGNHIQGNVLEVLNGDWDLFIGHPPCTYLAVSGARWFKDRQEEQREALDFVRALMRAPIKRIAIENPVSIISTKIRKPDQIIQPWMFGHPESKKTCLWLKNLPKLVPTNILKMPDKGYWDNQTPSGQNKIGPSPNRGKIRSKSYTGISNAMAKQWSGGETYKWIL